MMHLRFPRNKGFFCWDELGCMGRALGFPANLFYKHIPEEYTQEAKGLQTAVFYDMLNMQKYFHKAVDGSFNIHTDEWNLCVINKALSLLDSRILSFEELHAIRVAFQTYENADTKGMPIDSKLLQRALKMCGRMISPLKMMHRVKHMREHFEEEDRIQLHEFLDLLLWCDPYEEAEIQPVELNMTKDDRNLLPLEDFEVFLSHYDERLNNKLNSNYMTQEWKFSKEKHGSKRLPKDVPPVDPQIREKQVRYHKDRYCKLHSEVTQSQGRLHKAQAGYVRDRPLTAPDIFVYKSPNAEDVVENSEDRPPTVFETFRHLIRPHTSPDSQTLHAIRNEFPRPELSEYQRPQTATAVTGRDRALARDSMDALKFEMETIEMKYRQMLNEDMDFLLPGYREKLANLPTESPVRTVKVRVVPEPRPSPEAIQRLASPYKPGPPPAHARSCDARFRGWKKVGHRRGNHFVLVAPSYDSSQKGQLMLKMCLSAQAEIQRGDYIYRHTKADQVTPETALEAQLAKKGLPPSGNPKIRVTKEESVTQQSSTDSSEINILRIAVPPSTAKPVKSADDSSLHYSDFQMYAEATPETSLFKDTKGSSNTHFMVTNAQEPGTKMATLKPVGKLSVMEEIKESDNESLADIVSQGKMGQLKTLKFQGVRSPSVSTLGDFAIPTPSPTPGYEFLPKTEDSEWIRDVLQGKKREVNRSKMAKSFRRLSTRAVNVGTQDIQHRLMATV